MQANKMTEKKTTAADIFKEANGHFVEEEFTKAAKLYDDCIQFARDHDTMKPTYYLYRAANHLKMENYLDALPDCIKCLRLDPEQHKAWLRKGIAYFNLQEYESSLASFQKGKETGSRNCDSWIKQCQAELKREETISAFQPPTSNAEPSYKKKQKVRPNWCQSDVNLTLTLFVKKLKKRDVTIKCEEKKLHVTLNLPDATIWKKTWFLWGSVVPDKLKKSVSAYKVEMILSKVVHGEDWETLEDVEHHVPDDDSKCRIGSAKGKKTEQEWDELEQDMKAEENLKPGDGMQALFRHLYNKNDDATKRAFNKSYSESGGTVLSSNWNEVKDKDYTKDIQAPEGAEVRKFTDLEN